MPYDTPYADPALYDVVYAHIQDDLDPMIIQAWKD